MQITLFVDNLPAQLSQAQLEAFFADFHPVRVLVATHRSGRCLGFGFVVFATRDEADHAVQHLNGACLNGSPIRLSDRIAFDHQSHVA